MNGGSPRQGGGDVSSRDNIEMSSSTGISDHYVNALLTCKNNTVRT